ncbi:Dichloromethane dehalogenase [Pragia fontium]|uniref:Glutathione S-transferase n=2 Tax=Pragia fontium TaxID=82985 RepID=A0AAJ4W8H8_9GAMM|nr:glutathione S-transferase family protein [Pragia fontium]AKJ41035.1 glutathione S-transferase [Pragia fontium]GKX63201.1 glutathione S-transferase [Pragia fontium]SFC18048.1 glutathione S-transferase [Pragia fontium DSM 5563 = ATCC 49100]SUB81225.1 Dichloromethane dehalogenase [Pragia fontium]
MYQLYIANKNYSSWSLRPWILLSQLGLPFEEIIVPFTDTNWDSFRSFSPSGKVPCLTDGEITVWDSLAIAEYLAEDHPEIWPESREARTWARCASAEMHSGFNALRNTCPMNVGIRVRPHQHSEALLKDLARLSELWEQGLNLFGGHFLAGKKFTAVDAFFAPVAFRIQSYDLPVSPAAKAYTERLLNLQSMMEWEEEALKEVWREEEHERETQEVGIILQDLRA